MHFLVENRYPLRLGPSWELKTHSLANHLSLNLPIGKNKWGCNKIYFEHHLHKGHVHFVNVGSLFSVYFDVDEVFIHYLGNFFIFKRFVFHHMTPMTSWIAHREEYQFVLLLSFIKCLLTPWVPEINIYYILSLTLYSIVCLSKKLIINLPIHGVCRMLQ
jgi:hypothetical protein